MATYAELQGWIRERHGWTPKTCWIAHCKELAGLPSRDAPNRQGAERKVPCPPGKRPPTFDAFRRFGMTREGFERECAEGSAESD